MKTPKQDTAQKWIQTLGLARHPEGGWFRQTYRASLVLPQSALSGHSGARAAATMIYFLLAGEDFSAFHRLRSDEGWHFYAGSPLIVHVIEPEGRYSEILLGGNADADQRFQAIVPAGCWFGSSLLQPETYALVGCTVAPGFDFADFEMAQREKLTAEYPQHRNVIARLTRP